MLLISHPIRDERINVSHMSPYYHSHATYLYVFLPVHKKHVIYLFNPACLPLSLSMKWCLNFSNINGSITDTFTFVWKNNFIISTISHSRAVIATSISVIFLHFHARYYFVGRERDCLLGWWWHVARYGGCE